MAGLTPPSLLALDALAGWSDDQLTGLDAALLPWAGRHGPPPSVRADDLKAWLEKRFVARTVSPESPDGLLTGYFEPEFAGALSESPRYPIPLYRRPPDLVNIVPESERATTASGYSHMRRDASGALLPYPRRREIESGALSGRGLELVWLTDPVDAFILHVQGSGRIRLDDGRVVRLTYDGKNGHPYTSIGRVVIDQGWLPAADLTLDKLADWLRADPGRAREVMWRNPSFVFFRALADDEPGPLGASGHPLTPGRSLAVDPSFHPLGSLIFVTAPALELDGKPFARLMVAEDVGSAIRGPVRGDLFIGTGVEAGRIAGAIKTACRFHVLSPVEHAS